MNVGDISRETTTLLEKFVELVRIGTGEQNLIAASTVDGIWQRHVLDSLQLVAFGQSSGTWLDIGSGAGFPGIVITIATSQMVVLVEPRGKRALFLQHVVATLGLNATVMACPIERVPSFEAANITARAVAALPHLVAMARPFCTPQTRLVFPKGRRGKEELASLPAKWQSHFESHSSLTDPESIILTATGLPE